MSKYVLMVSLAALLAGCGDKVSNTEVSNTKAAEQTQTVPATQVASVVLTPADLTMLVQEAKGASQALGGTLKGELETAMKAGGPVEALNICHSRAPVIAQSISTEKGLQVSRVSLKNRNPTMGVPTDWQIQVLNDFEARKAAGQAPETLLYAAKIGNEFRFMKAIPTGEVCLKCHGTTISPEVSAKLKELYPEDQATGFKQGDLRGAFVVVKKLAQ